MYGECFINGKNEQEIESIQVLGEVNIRAMLPGDTPKVQVKVALPEDYDEFCVHNMCIRPQNQSDDEDMVYRLGNQRFGMATIIPPTSGAFTLMKYTSHEDKSLQLPMSLHCQTKARFTDSLDFSCVFKLNKLVDMQSDDCYFPLIQDVSISFLFPSEVKEVSVVCSVPNLTADHNKKDEGSWSYDAENHVGTWLFDPVGLMTGD